MPFTPSPVYKVHFILNTKGGVGKSLVAFILAQAHRHLNLPVKCFDADATTATFSSFTALNVERIELLEGTVINDRGLDQVMEPVMTEAAHFVIDTGTSTYVAVSNYLIENDVHNQIRSAGKRVAVHVIIVGGGRTLRETLSDFDDLAAQLPPEVDIIVWLNEHFGEIRQDGKAFREMQVYQEHQARVSGLVLLPQRTASTFGADVKEMMQKHLTFEEAVASPEFSLMSKQRLKIIQRDVYGQLESLL
jgi:hypothetical protein